MMQASRVRDRVRDAEELDRQRPDIDGVADLDYLDGGLVEEPLLLQLDLHQPSSQSRAVHRDVQLTEEERQPADVVLVAVREEDGLQKARPLCEVGDLGDHDVHAQHLVLGEHQTHVYSDGGAIVFVQHHVAANVAKAAEGNHT